MISESEIRVENQEVKELNLIDKLRTYLRLFKL